METVKQIKKANNADVKELNSDVKKEQIGNDVKKQVLTDEKIKEISGCFSNLNNAAHRLKDLNIQEANDLMYSLNTIREVIKNYFEQNR